MKGAAEFCEKKFITIGYWFHMDINVQVPVRNNFARRRDRNINFAPERLHIFPYQTNNLLLHNYNAL